MMSWMLLGAGIACFGLAMGALLIAWVGGWATGTEYQRLSIVGWALLGALTGMLSVIVSLAIGGPVGRFNAKLSRNGLDVEANDKPDAVATVIATTGTNTPPTS
jgi:membrane protein implicated in regulation of membrane protease activity